MMRWSLAAEFFSLFILAVVFLRYYCYEWRVAYTSRRKLFLCCLISAAASILLNIACVYAIARAAQIPLWLNLLLNSAYFLLSVVMCGCYAYFLFTLILEHVYDAHCMRRAVLALVVLTAGFAAVVAVNPLSGLLFSFDSRGVYHRGPLNRLGYAILLAELALLGVCYIRNRSSVSKTMVQVMRSLPPLVLMLAAYQIFYPELLLNGTICAVSSLILFLSFQSHTNDRDSLTNLRNRENFLTELTLRTGGHQPLQVIVVCLLSFSDVNLQYGHAAGDAVLYEAARYLDGVFPQGRAFRVNNLTFTLTLPWISQEQADARLETILRRFQEPWVLGDLRISFPFCMTDLHCRGQETTDQVVDWLEYALALAKEERGVVRFNEQVRRRMEQRQALIASMRRSIQERRFRVWYQPIYSCQDASFHTAEALLRLTDETGAPVSPSVFIPLAEETGMIGDLTWIVLEEICKLLSSGAAPGLRSVSLNLSMQQLLDPGLAKRFQRYLTEYGLTPDRLKIEITERFLLHDARYAKTQLDALTGIGLEIYMDDFGTGYSNFSSVLDFPFSCIKLDRSLILHVPGDPHAELMVRTLTTLFHDMGKHLVVEGVETQALAEHLHRIGADMIQGFYYAVPMPQEELLDFFSAQNNPG